MTSLIALESGTELAGDFRIERVLGAGGFGVTYLAREIALNRLVTIKEYFPADFAARAEGREAHPRSENCAGDYKWGLERFLEEAQTLALFNHPNIVRVYRYFRANNTGYMVLHFEEGQSLKAWLKGLGRAPRQKELDAIVGPLLDALETIHKADFLHRDIAPDNIIIRKDGQPVLIDFGSARGEIAAHSKTVSALVKPGYSPYEQYAETSRQQGPWTDIYALGATLYHAVAGKRPPDSPSRMVKDEMLAARDAALAAYRPGFLKAIDRALALSIDARPQTVAAWRGDLLAPEPAKPGWFQRGNEKKSESPSAVPPGGAAQAKSAATHVPPPPDAPGPEGGMLDFIEGAKKKPEPKPAPKSDAKAASSAAEKPAAKPSANDAAEATAKISDPPEPIRWSKLFKPKPGAKPKAPKAASTPPPAAEPPPDVIAVRSDPKPATPKPNPIRASKPKSWRPLLFKLLVGVGIASGAVAMQDRLPHVASTTSSVRTGSTQSSDSSTQTQALLPEVDVKAHDGGAVALRYSDDGRSIVTAGNDGVLKVWSAASASLLRAIPLPDGAPSSLALSGARALTGHANGNVVLWDFERGERIATFKRNDAEVWAVTFLGAPDRFAAASHDWKVTIWDAGSATPAHVIDAHDNAVQAAAFASTPDGPRLVTGGADKTARVWNIDTLEQVRRYSGHSDFVTTLAFAPDGKSIASAGLDGNIRLWSPDSRSTLRRLYGHRGRVGALAFAPDGRVLVSAGEDGKVRVWDLKRGRTARVLPGTVMPQRAVAVSPDGQRIAAAGDDGELRIWANPIAGTLTN